MAKNYSWFKFTSSEWLTGDIVFEPLSVQGLFINICAIYWQRDGELSLDDINKRYNNPKEIAKLTDRFFSVKDGFIIIKFLDEQLIEVGRKSQVNSENGKKGGRPKSLTDSEKKAKETERLAKQSEAKRIKADKIREEEEKRKKREEGKEIVLDDWDGLFKTWIDFRNEKKKPLTETSIRLGLDELKKLSNQNIETAKEIVKRSMTKGWQGLFAIETKTNNQPPTTSRTYKTYDPNAD